MSDWDNPNNGNDDWYNEEPIMEDEIQFSEEDNQATETVQEDIKPVRLSKRKAVWFAISVVFIIMILSIISANLDEGKKAKNLNNSGSVEIQQQQIPNTTSNSVDKSNNFSENQVVSEGVGIYSTGDVKPEESGSRNNASTNESTDIEEPLLNEEQTSQVEEGVEENANQGTESGLVKVKEPTLGEVREVAGAVLSKNVFKMDRTYGYMIEFVVINNSNKEVILNYFCPRKTFDALTIGDPVKIQYQTSEDGTISIASVSR